MSAQRGQPASAAVERRVVHVLLPHRLDELGGPRALQASEDALVLGVVRLGLRLERRVEPELRVRVGEPRRQLAQRCEVDRRRRLAQRHEARDACLEQRPLIPWTQRLVDIGVDARNGDATDDIRGAALERRDQQRREDAAVADLQRRLVRTTRSQDRDALAQDDAVVRDRRKPTKRARVAAVEDHDRLVRRRGVGKRQHVDQRDTVAVRRRVRRDEVPAEVARRAVAGEVQKHDVGRAREQLLDVVAHAPA